MKQPVFSRVVVLDVFADPTKVTQTLLKYYGQKYNLLKTEKGLVLPRNTIVGKKILDSAVSSLEQAMFFIPFFSSHLSLPCSPGEHVWALVSENESVIQDVGYWFSRITEVIHADDVNHTHPPRAYEVSYSDPTTQDKFEFNNSIPTYIKGERKDRPASQFIHGDGDAYRDLIKRDENQINASNLIIPRPVPRYKKRPGDVVLEGSNNTLISLGTNRSGSVADYTQKSLGNQGTVNVPSFPQGDLPYGSIDIVAGRGKDIKTGGFTTLNELEESELNKSPKNRTENEGDPDFKNDSSRILVSEQTRIDSNFGLDGFNAQFSIEDSVDGNPAIVIKTDKIRFIARKDVEIVVTNDDDVNSDNYAAVVVKSNGDIVFKPSNSGYIKLGDDTADKSILCTATPFTELQPGQASHTPILNTMGGAMGKGAVGPNDFGSFSTKVLIK